jgi:hypothetical protein
MADASLLASIISGTNPMAPTMLGSYQGAQLQNAALDSNFGHNEGLFGALAKTLAGFSGGNALRQGVQQTTAANQAALPDLAKLLANPDPYTALAGNTAGFDPIAAARLLQGATPEDVAKARLASAQAGLATAQTNEYKNLGQPRQPTFIPTTGGMAGSPSAMPTTASDLTNGRQSLVSGADPVAALTALPPDQRAARIAMMTSQQKAALAAALKKQQGGR